MKTELTAIISLEERDIRLAATNGGLMVELPPGTVRVVVRVVAQLDPAKSE